MSRKGKNSGEGETHSAFAAAPVAIVCVLALLHGGYYAVSTCAIALVGTVAYAVWAVLSEGRRICPRTTLLVLAIALLFLTSSFVHGSTATMLQETASWFAVAGLSLWCVQGTRHDKQRVLEWLATAGSVLGGVGILAFAGTVLSGATMADRLTFPFEYANTAGLFFAVSAVLGFSSLPHKRRAVAVVPVVALLLTQSVGAIVVFSIAGASLLAHRAHHRKAQRGKAIAIVAGIVAALAACFALFRERVLQSMQTFIERVIQVLDAASLFSGNAVFGIGPDQWQIAYSTAQSAQYRAAVVHCSYAQIALDGGLLALAAVLVLVVGGLLRLAKRGDSVSLACAAMVAVHALFDFDLQFSAIVVLLIALLAQPMDVSGPGSSKKDGLRSLLKRAETPFCWLTLAFSLAFSCFGIVLDVQMGYVQNAGDGGDAEQAVEALASAPWLEGDPLMREYVVGALYEAGDYDSVLDETAGGSDATESLGLYRALAQRAIGEDAAAQSTYARVLHEHPYSVELFEAVRKYIVDEGLEDDYAPFFNEEAYRANELASSGRAAWLSNQMSIELI